MPPTPKILPTEGQRSGCPVSPADGMKLGKVCRKGGSEVSLTKRKREREMRPALSPLQRKSAGA